MPSVESSAEVLQRWKTMRPPFRLSLALQQSLIVLTQAANGNRRTGPPASLHVTEQTFRCPACGTQS